MLTSMRRKLVQNVRSNCRRAYLVGATFQDFKKLLFINIYFIYYGWFIISNEFYSQYYLSYRYLIE